MFNADTQTVHLNARYNSVAAGWQRKMESLGYAAAYREAITVLFPATERVGRVMDVGCGAGDFAAAYLALCPRPDVLTLADPAEGMLHQAEARLCAAADQLISLDAAISDLPALPTQDLILCAHVIDHCADPVHALRALARGLAPGGALLLIASKPHWCNWLMRMIWGHRSRAPDQMLQAILAAGLICRRDTGFASGPPRRTSHAYLITLTQPEITYADCHR